MCLVMGVIFFLSHQPGSDLNLPLFNGADKILHATAYGVLAISSIFAFPKTFKIAFPFATAFFVVVICLLYGIADEYHQSFIPGRSPDIFDVAADVLGAIIVSSIWYIHKTKS